MKSLDEIVAHLDTKHIPHVHSWLAVLRGANLGWHFYVSANYVRATRSGDAYSLPYVQGYFRRVFDEWAERQ